MPKSSKFIAALAIAAACLGAAAPALVNIGHGAGSTEVTGLLGEGRSGGPVGDGRSSGGPLDTGHLGEGRESDGPQETGHLGEGGPDDAGTDDAHTDTGLLGEG